MADRLFSTTQAGSTSTNTPSIQQQRQFNSLHGGSFSTNTPIIQVQNWFATSQNIEISTNDTNFSIIGTSNIPIAPKKIQYIIDDLVTSNVEFYYPKYKELIHSFLKFLDLTSIKTTLNILNNNNINYVYDEYIDSFLNNFFKDIIDLDTYGLTDTNKRRFLQLSRILMNLKGNSKSFDFLFRSFTDIRVAQDDIQIEIDKIIVEFIEDESFWNPTIANYYDGSIDYDGTYNYYTWFQKAFTYQFKIDQNRTTMIPLIRAVHPAGFDYEFSTELTFEDDDVEFEDEAEVTTRYFHYYAYGEPNMTNYTYDGSITYSEYHDVNVEF